jgi:DNA-binding CsgD family transcriptional regulator
MDSTTISRTHCLTPADARNMLRLGNSLHRSPGDPVTRKRILLQGIARLVEAHGAISVVTTCDRLTARQTVISVVRTDAPDAPVSPSDPPAARTAPLRLKRGGRIAQLAAAESGWRPPEHCQCCDSFIDLLGMQVVATLTVYRQPADAPPFSQREREIVNAVHAEMAWVYEQDLLMTSPEALALPPRKRETLQYLLAGDRETQIAAKVEMSRATIHNHVKSLYRHFNVATRNELLEKWSKRKEPGPPAVP